MTSEQTNEIRADEPMTSREILRAVYDAMSEKGYNPIGQIVGYLLSEDPTYITNYNNARALIRKIDRDELMSELVKCYLELN
jgi:uncharacterized protein (UPF0297 family)